MTIARYFAAIKSSLRSPSDSTHYEFVSKSVAKSSQWKVFQSLSNKGELVELRVSGGNSDHKKFARKIARELDID